MGRIDCRKKCGVTRSTTVVSTDGEHIPECHNPECGDEAYLLPFEDEKED